MKSLLIMSERSLPQLDRTEYSQVLHKVVDVLREYPSEMWIEVGKTVKMEGLYQIEAAKRGDVIEYD